MSVGSRSLDFLSDRNLQEGGLLFALQAAGEACRPLLQQRLAPLRLMADDACVLLMLDKKKELLQEQIATALGINRNQLVKILTSLESRKCLIRVRDSANRRR